MSEQYDSDDVVPAIPRKLSLRVSGSRIGSLARPAAPSLAAAGPSARPRFGLKVNRSTLGRVAPVAAPAVIDADDTP